MKAISPIRTDADHAAALAEVRRLWGATPGTAAGDRLDVLLVLIDDFEARQHALDGATVARGGPSRAWTAPDQPRDRSPATKKNCIKPWRKLM